MWIKFSPEMFIREFCVNSYLKVILLSFLFCLHYKNYFVKYIQQFINIQGCVMDSICKINQLYPCLALGDY